MFQLMMHSTHLQLYDIGHMTNDHSDSKRGNLLPPLHGLVFLISSKSSFIYTISHSIAHTKASGTPVVEHWLERYLKAQNKINITFVPTNYGHWCTSGPTVNFCIFEFYNSQIVRSSGEFRR